MSFVVEPLAERNRPDVFIGAIGYESRSSWALGQGWANGAKIVGFPFPTLREGAFSNSLERYREEGAFIAEAGTETEFRDALRAITRDLIGAGRPAAVTVDISSFSRRRLATVVTACKAVLSSVGGAVDFIYSPAEFHDYREPEGTLSAEPVTRDYRGVLRRSSIPIAAIFGLGYEPRRAAGAFELLEPSKIWLFQPVSPDQRFDAAIEAANAHLLSLVGEQGRLEYPVIDPAATFMLLDSLVFSIKRSSRLVLVPMGPKPFALACMLLGASNEPERPAVWRVGPRGHHGVDDARASGPVVGLRAHWSAEGGARR